MSGILLGAWLFWMTAFCALGVACRLACARRRGRGSTCICGRHEDQVSKLAEESSASGATARPSRLRAAESRVRALQQRYVEGLLSMEQYEVELDRVVGAA
jgi:hypothetical protein